MLPTVFRMLVCEDLALLDPDLDPDPVAMKLPKYFYLKVNCVVAFCRSDGNFDKAEEEI
jgi:hypothetical protein